MRHVEDFLAARIREVASAQLPCALQKVPYRRATGETIDVVRRPTVLVHQRRQEERRIRHTSSDDDVRAARQCGQQSLGAEIGVGGNDRRVRRDRIAALHRGLVQVERGEHIVTRDGGNLDGNPQATGDGHDRICCRKWIGCAAVRDELDSPALQNRQQCLDARRQSGVVAAGRIAASTKLRQRNRALGEHSSTR
jgi:hypothetical protein